LYKNYKLQPVSIISFYTIGLALLLLIAQNALPHIGNSFVDAAIRSSIIAIIYCAIVWKLKWTPLMNEMVEKKLGKFLKR
jgi:hypothetical protein